ncbi:LysE family transporter [Piscinibacter sakaiensis]|uniref:LysE/ArgO family amino acid transporter n=1 Tax=Piscinibacter sakaiensis TaxID=1547922 RepID=UPI003729BA86
MSPATDPSLAAAAAAAAPATATAAGAFVQGGLMTAGLIVAIGAQNALVLQQGLRRTHVGPVVALCTASDWLLIAAGVFGLGSLVRSAPGLLEVFRWGGASFLLAYGALALRRAWTGGPAAAPGCARRWARRLR